MWTYVHREFFLTIFGQCINVLNYKNTYTLACRRHSTLYMYMTHIYELNFHNVEIKTNNENE